MNSPTVRLAAANEIEPALRLLLGNDQHLADLELVRQFIADAQTRDLSLDRLWLAVDAQHIHWTILPIASAGHTGILVGPNRTMPKRLDATLETLIRHCCHDLRSADVQVIQVLLDPADDLAARLHTRCGFEDLAVLEYLRIPAAHARAAFPTGFELRPAPSDIDLSTALQSSYIDTLDCPRLNGIRTLPDIIDGYRQAQPYDPSLWHVLYQADQPIGVLLLSSPGKGDPLELSYLGLAPTVRGRGLGATLVQRALNAAAQRESRELAVTVDAQNDPAKRLYFRVGGRLILNRRVLIRLV